MWDGQVKNRSSRVPLVGNFVFAGGGRRCRRRRSVTAGMAVGLVSERHSVIARRQWWHCRSGSCPPFLCSILSRQDPEFFRVFVFSEAEQSKGKKERPRPDSAELPDSIS